jgi:hypothetical protein
MVLDFILWPYSMTSVIICLGMLPGVLDRPTYPPLPTYSNGFKLDLLDLESIG